MTEVRGFTILILLLNYGSITMIATVQMPMYAVKNKCAKIASNAVFARLFLNSVIYKHTPPPFRIGSTRVNPRAWHDRGAMIHDSDPSYYYWQYHYDCHCSCSQTVYIQRGHEHTRTGN